MTAIERSRKYRKLHNVEIAAKAREKRALARKALIASGITPRNVGGQTGPRSTRKCNCGTCKVCIHRETNKRCEERKRLNQPRPKYKCGNLDRPEIQQELEIMDKRAQASLAEMREYRKHQSVYFTGSPLAEAHRVWAEA